MNNNTDISNLSQIFDAKDITILKPNSNKINIINKDLDINYNNFIGILLNKKNVKIEKIDFLYYNKQDYEANIDTITNGDDIKFTINKFVYCINFLITTDTKYITNKIKNSNDNVTLFRLLLLINKIFMVFKTNLNTKILKISTNIYYIILKKNINNNDINRELTSFKQLLVQYNKILQDNIYNNSYSIMETLIKRTISSKNNIELFCF